MKGLMILLNFRSNICFKQVLKDLINSNEIKFKLYNHNSQGLNDLQM